MEQMPSNDPVVESKPGPAGWVQTWIMAVTKPSENTFVILTENPGATSRTAFIWVFIAGVISSISSTIVQAIYSAMGTTPQLPSIPGLENLQQFNQFNQGGGGAGAVGISLLTGICLSPLGGLLTVLFFAIGVAIIQWIAKLFGGVGTFDKLAYAFAAIAFPFAVVSALLTLLGAIPYVNYCTGILSFVLGIYSLVLQIMAVKVVNRFGYGPAAGSVFIPGCLIFLICGCILAAGMAVLGPIISEAFQNIQQGLPPAP